MPGDGPPSQPLGRRPDLGSTIDAAPADAPRSGAGPGEPGGEDPGATVSASSLVGRAAAAASQDEPDGLSPAWKNKRLGKFRLIELLGQGTMGKVFRASDTMLKRDVALKVMTIQKGQPEHVERLQLFVREARAAARLSHPYIVNVLEIDQHADMVYIAMDLIDCGDVKAMIQREGPLDPGFACDLAADVAEALAYGHRAGVIHRDVKPANVVLTCERRAKLADFGLADLQQGSERLRLRDEVVGTPRYMAPEVARGLPAIEASDQYSLGATLWHMLAGQPIFNDESVRDVLHHQVHTPPPSLRQLRPVLPRQLIETIEKTLAKDPADRYPDCDALARRLRALAIALIPPETGRGRKAGREGRPQAVGEGGAAGAGGWGGGGAMGSSRRRLPPLSLDEPTRRRVWLTAVPSAAAVGLLIGGAVWWQTWPVADDLEGPIAAARQALEPPDAAAQDRDRASAKLAQITAQRAGVEAAFADDAARDRAAADPSASARPGVGSDTAAPTVTPSSAEGAAELGASEPARLTAGQTEALLQLAADSARAVVRGQVAEAYVSGSGKTFIVRFLGNETRDFQAVWFPERFEMMQQFFDSIPPPTTRAGLVSQDGGAAEGGSAAPGQAVHPLVGRRIAVRGAIENSFGIPRIVITDPRDQLEFLDAGAAAGP